MVDKPGWEEENQLASSLGFVLTPDPHRGGRWSMFCLGPWYVWKITQVKVDRRIAAWQVAHVKWDDELGQRYTAHLTKTGVEPVTDLRVALTYAKARHDGNTMPAAELIRKIESR